MYLVPNKMSGNSIAHFAERDNEKPRNGTPFRGFLSVFFFFFVVRAFLAAGAAGFSAGVVSGSPRARMLLSSF